MRWRLVVLVAVVLTAGCGSLFAADGGAERAEQATLTPAPVPEITPTPEQWPLAPGLTADGVADADVLAEAHREAVANRSYVFRVRRGFGVRVNGTVPTNHTTVARVESPRVYRVWTHEEEVRFQRGLTQLDNYSVYANGTASTIRSQLPDQLPTVRRQSAITPAVQHRHIGVRATDAVRQFLAVGNVTVTPVRFDGRRHYLVSGGSYSGFAAGALDNENVTALVSPEGFVRSLDVSYSVRRMGDPRSVRYTFTYERVGNTTVDRPDWVDAD
ncbi:MAG: hypothetical protein ABEI39_04655 [Halobacteriales archaeon]